MSDDTKKDGKSEGKLSLKAPRRIVLKKTVEGGSIRQNFSHGRSKSVVVEVRRKRTFVKADAEAPSGETLTRKQGAGRSLGSAEGAGSQENPAREGESAGRSSSEERQQHILTPMTAEERRRYEEEQRQERERQEREAIEAKRLQEEEAERAREEAEARAKEAAIQEAAAAEESAARAQAQEAVAAEAAAEAPAEAQPASEAKAAETPAEAAPEAEAAEGPTEAQPAPEPEAAKAPADSQPTPEPEAAKAPTDSQPTPEAEAPAKPKAEPEPAPKSEPAPEPEPQRPLSRQQREEVARQKTEDLVAKRLTQLEDLREQKRLIEARRAQEAAAGAGAKQRETLKAKGPKRKTRKGAGQPMGGPSGPGRRGRGGRGDERKKAEMPVAPVVRDVVVPETITVGELASRMAVKSSKVIKLLFTQGLMVTINQALDQDTAMLVVEEMGHKAKGVSESAAIEAELAEAEDAPETLVERPPVVTVMGHVDHGKTSLLDAIRNTEVTAGEHGGITQHIGAYQVTLAGGKKITFLDTPGHAAFTAMRARGAKATDIVILVVAADDGVMPQTLEAVSHAKQAGVPVIVAVNKMDRPDANPDRIMQQLSEQELIPEDWGGDTIFARVSAKTGEGIEELQEMILLQAEVLALTANPEKRARGVIVEANLDRGRGAVATCLVQTGALRVGDIFVAGHEWGKIRGLVTDKGENIEVALPAMPVEIIGLSGIPMAGDDLVVVPDEKRARDIAAFRIQRSKEAEHAKQAPAKLDELFDQIKQGEKIELKVVIKGDVQGSVEAVTDALRKIEHEQVQTTPIHVGVGGINESDLMLAVASQALVLGFNVRADAKAREIAKREKIEMRFYNVIYNLVDDITQAMEGLLAPTIEETVLGHADVREVFRISKVGNVAGCQVTDGVVQRGVMARLLRDQVVVYEGTVSALKRFKDDAKEVREGLECGISLERFSDVKPGDVIEVFSQQEVKTTIAR